MMTLGFEVLGVIILALLIFFFYLYHPRRVNADRKPDYVPPAPRPKTFEELEDRLYQMWLHGGIQEASNDEYEAQRGR